MAQKKKNQGKSSETKKDLSGMSREDRIAEICKQINEGEHGGEEKNAVTWLGSRDAVSLQRFSSGDVEIDRALGGGWPKGRIIELYGPESGGKTTACLHAIAEHQKEYPDEEVALIDSEYCLARGTLVYDAKSMTYHPVENLEDKEFDVCSWVNSKMTPQKAFVQSSGERNVFLVKCSFGRSIRLTDNHRVLTQDGYKEVSEVSKNDKMYIPQHVPSTNSTFVANGKFNLYRLLGYHIGDGTCGKSEISTSDEEVVEDLQSIADNHDCSVSFDGKMARFRSKTLKYYDVSAENLREMFSEGLLIEEVALLCGCSEPTISRRIKEYGLDTEFNFRQNAAFARNSRDTNIKKAETTYRGRLANPAFNFLSKFECFHNNSKLRRLPKGLNNYQLSQVLAGIFMADGSVVDYQKQKKCALYYSTSSRILAMDIQVALQRLGIFSSLCEDHKQRKNGEYYDTCYSVWVRGYYDVARFHECVHLKGYKHERVRNALSMTNPNRSKNDSRDCEGLIAVDVLSIKHDGVCETFDVSVQNSNDKYRNFLAEGLIVHNSFDEEYAEAVGVQTKYLIVHQPESGEQALNVLEKLITLGVGCAVIDSVAALTTKRELEGNVGDDQVAEQARLMSPALRRIAAGAGKRGTVLMFTNQVRENIGVTFGDKTTTPAGRALKHYSSIRCQFKRIGSEKETIDGEEVPIANQVKAEVKKNKTAPPFRSATFYIVFGVGIDPVITLFDNAVKYKIVEKRGAWFSFKGENIGQGRMNTINEVRQNQDLLNRLQSAVNKKIGKQPVTDEEQSSEEEPSENQQQSDQKEVEVQDV